MCSSLQRTSLSLFFAEGEDSKESTEGAKSTEGEATETGRKEGANEGSELARMLEAARSKYQTYRYDRFGLQETFNSKYVDMEQQEDNIDKAEKRIAMRLNELTRRVLSDGLYLLVLSDTIPKLLLSLSVLVSLHQCRRVVCHLSQWDITK
jgi:hypothetical protein